MTANEMRTSFLIKFDKLFDFGAPAYDDRQISALLTEAQWKVFIKRYNPLGNKYKKGFEKDEQRRRDLDQLLKPALYLSTGDVPTDVEEIIKNVEQQNGIHTNGIFLEMPSDFLYIVGETVKLNGSSKEVGVQPKTHDEYSPNINNPFQEPSTKEIWRMDISRHTHASGTDTSASAKRVELILPEGSTLDQYIVRYLSMPPNIVTNITVLNNQRHCILDESIHPSIIDEAVVLAQAASKIEAYQIGLNETNRSE